MRYKAPELVLEFERAHPRAQALAYYIDNYSQRRFGHDIMITDVERDKAAYEAIYGIGYTGPMPHLGPHSRAFDFRTVGEFTDDQMQEMSDHINGYWVRADGKPTLIHHDVGAGSHGHGQVQV